MYLEILDRNPHLNAAKGAAKCSLTAVQITKVVCGSRIGGSETCTQQHQ